jgi:hypothetical protein
MKAKIEWSDVETGKQKEVVAQQDPHKYIPVCTLMVVTDNEKKVLHTYYIYLKGVTGRIHIEER